MCLGQVTRENLGCTVDGSKYKAVRKKMLFNTRLSSKNSKRNATEIFRLTRAGLDWAYVANKGEEVLPSTFTGKRHCTLLVPFYCSWKRHCTLFVPFYWSWKRHCTLIYSMENYRWKTLCTLLFLYYWSWKKRCTLFYPVE